MISNDVSYVTNAFLSNQLPTTSKTLYSIRVLESRITLDMDLARLLPFLSRLGMLLARGNGPTLCHCNFI